MCFLTLSKALSIDFPKKYFTYFANTISPFRNEPARVFFGLNYKFIFWKRLSDKSGRRCIFNSLVLNDFSNLKLQFVQFLMNILLCVQNGILFPWSSF